MKLKASVLASLLLAISSVGAQPSDYPNKPIRFIVPFAPGSGADRSGRLFGEELSKVLGTPVVVENKPGVSGLLGALAVKNAPADGYHILVAGWSAQTVTPIIMKDPLVDSIKEFKPISGLSRAQTVFVAPKNSPYDSLEELLAAAKRDNRELSVGTISAGQQIVLEWFSHLADVKFQNIPYTSGSGMMTDLMGERIDWAVEGLQSAGPLIADGKIKALAVAGTERSKHYPSIPTVQESGYPDFFSYGWSGLYVRADTSDEITDKLAQAMQTVMKIPRVREVTEAGGSELMPLGAREMREYELAELRRFQDAAKKAGIEPQ